MVEGTVVIFIKSHMRISVGKNVWRLIISARARISVCNCACTGADFAYMLPFMRTAVYGVTGK